jgi:hypothetical protein
MNAKQFLGEHKSSFNIFSPGRFDGNNRPYAVEGVRRMIGSKETQQRIQINEGYGYFGHGKRQHSNKLLPDESEIVTVQGKMVVLNDQPSNITTQLAINDDGEVTHRQLILNNTPGATVQGLIASGVGGWSWAVTGTPTQPQRFGGFDYVKRPSYLNTGTRQLLLESCGVENEIDLILHNLQQEGLTKETSQLMLESWQNLNVVTDEQMALQTDVLMMEALIAKTTDDKAIMAKELNTLMSAQKSDQEIRRQMLLESVDTLPIILTTNQLNAFTSMKTSEDAQIVKIMFEGIKDAFLTLPGQHQVPLFVHQSPVRHEPTDKPTEFSSQRQNPFNKTR